MNKVGKRIVTFDDTEDEFELDYKLSELATLMSKKTKKFYWYCVVENFGWRNLSGYKYFHATTALEFLHSVLPDCPCTSYVHNWGRGIAIQNYHHDSPTGNEWYYIKPVSKSTFEKNKNK